MATIKFKGKVQTVKNVDGTFAYSYIKVPCLETKHCNMHEFRVHKEYGCSANSYFFTSILADISEKIFPCGKLRLDAVPTNVTVNESSFLATVTINV